jgi:hypothetical protein
MLYWQQCVVVSQDCSRGRKKLADPDQGCATKQAGLPVQPGPDNRHTPGNARQVKEINSL